MELGAELGIARGVQWWYPGNPLQCKVFNRTKTAMTIQRGAVIAKVFATNSSDTERMRLLLDQSEEKEPSPAVEGERGGAEMPTGDVKEVAVDIAEANMGQLSQGCKSDLLELLREYRDRGLFPANPKVVPACHGAKLRLPLTREDCTPYAAKQRRYSPEEETMIQSEVTKQFQTGAIRRSTSAWAANCVVVRKKDGTARVCQDYRGLNASLKSDSGGLGDIQSIFDGMKGASCFTSIDLASGFTQLEIAEEDKHKTAFRDAHGTLWELNRCGFGLKTLPAGFAAFVGGALGSLKGKGVQNWLDDIIIYTKRVEGHLDLLRQVLEKLSKAGLSVNFSKSWWCCPQQEFVGMVVDRLGVRPSQSKIDAIAQLTRANTVEEVRALLGMTGYLRKFVPRYSALVFVRSIERNARGGERIISSKGKGSLRAANPIQSGVPPMNIVGSCDIPLVFMPEDRVRRVTVRVVEGLPYGLILGAAFLRQHNSVLNFAEGRGFKPAPESPWVPLRSIAGCSTLSERKTAGWKATPRKNRDTSTATLGTEAKAWERFCAVVPPSTEEEPEGLTEPPTVSRVGGRRQSTMEHAPSEGGEGRGFR